MFHYEHTRTGKLAELAEPKEIEAALLDAKVDEGLVVLAVKRQKRIISAMDDSKKWKRAAAPESAATAKKAAPAKKAPAKATDGDGAPGADGDGGQDAKV